MSILRDELKRRGLSKREVDVTALAASRAEAPRALAGELFISLGAFKFHLTSAYYKLGIHETPPHKRLQLMEWARPYILAEPVIPVEAVVKAVADPAPKNNDELPRGINQP